MILPGALPQALVGLRQSLGVAWLSLIVAEKVNADAGLGYLINNAREFLRTDVIVVGLAVYSLLGLLTDALVRLLERRALAWRSTRQPDPADPTRHPGRAPSRWSPATTARSGTTAGPRRRRPRHPAAASSSPCSAAAAPASRRCCAAWPASTRRPRGEVDVDGRTSVAFQEPRLLPWRRVGRQRRARAAQRPASRQEPARAARRRSTRSASPSRPTPGRSRCPAARPSGSRWPAPWCREPDLLLLDEPFSALDALTRIEMHRLVVELWERHRPAVLLVTHDVDEALAARRPGAGARRGPGRRASGDRRAPRPAHTGAPADRRLRDAGPRRPRRRTHETDPPPSTRRSGAA